MDTFNINNMLVLSSISGGQKQVMEVVLDGIPVLHLYDGCVSSSGDDIFETVGRVLFSPQSAEIRPSDVSQADITIDDKTNISMILLLYLNGLTQNRYEDVDVTTFSLAFGDRINSKKYLLYMKDSDILIAAMLHQWLDHRFLANPKEIIGLDNLVSKFMERLSDIERGTILFHIFKLYVLGFVNISPTVVYSNTEQNTHEKEKYLADRFAIASFISDKMSTGKCVRILTGQSPIEINCSTCSELAVVKDYFTTILAHTEDVYGVTVDSSSSFPCECDKKALRLMFFSGIKQLHLKLFREWYNEEKEFHTIELKVPDYIKNLYTYKMSGMDIVDIAILSLLKIKKFSLSELYARLSNYTEAEIYRSAFAMTVLGLVSPGDRCSGVPDIVPYIEKQAVMAAAPAPNKSLMGKLLEKIKFK